MRPVLDYVERLAGVDPRLSFLTLRSSFIYACETGDLVRVTSGLRTKKEQADLVARGKSQTYHSYHLRGLAVDLAIIRDGVAIWDHWAFHNLNMIFQEVAHEHGLVVTWGGSWAKLVDAVHWQLETFDPRYGVQFPQDT